jgi:hypothetical protein
MVRETIFSAAPRLIHFNYTEVAPMSTSAGLLEILEQLKQEAERVPEHFVPMDSWQDYRQWQEMWNPNWSRAAEIDIPDSCAR